MRFRPSFFSSLLVWRYATARGVVAANHAYCGLMWQSRHSTALRGAAWVAARFGGESDTAAFLFAWVEGFVDLGPQRSTLCRVLTKHARRSAYFARYAGLWPKFGPGRWLADH